MEGGASLPGQKEGRRREEKERRAKGEQEEPKERSNLIPDEEADMSKSNTMTGGQIYLFWGVHITGQEEILLMGELLSDWHASQLYSLDKLCLRSFGRLGSVQGP